VINEGFPKEADCVIDLGKSYEIHISSNSHRTPDVHCGDLLSAAGLPNMITSSRA
jgi:hypothetical protein